jgi:hypothetical protein
LELRQLKGRKSLGGVTQDRPGGASAAADGPAIICPGCVKWAAFESGERVSFVTGESTHRERPENAPGRARPAIVLLK